MDELSEEELAARRSNRRTLIAILIPVVTLGGLSLVKLALHLLSG